MTQPFLGIDFGTCNSSAAWFNPRTGQAESLLNAEGEDKTPSVVYFFGPHETVVGLSKVRKGSLPTRKCQRLVPPRLLYLGLAQGPCSSGFQKLFRYR